MPRIAEWIAGEFTDCFERLESWITERHGEFFTDCVITFSTQRFSRML